MKNKIVNVRVVILGALTFLSFLLRLLASSSEAVHPDSCLYLSFTKSILRGKFSFDFSEGVETILPPLYSISIAAVKFIAGDIELSGVLVSAVAGALLIIPVFYLAKAIYNERAAWIGSILVFISPILIHWSRAMLTESLFITLFISGITMGLYALEKRKRFFFFLSGALIGLSYMTRVIGLVAIPVLGLWMIYYLFKPGEKVGSLVSGKPDNPGDYNLVKVFKDAVTFLVIFSLGFFLVAGIYLIRLHSFYGQWTLAGSYGSITGTIANEGAETTEGWEKLRIEKEEESLNGNLAKKVTSNARNYFTSLLRMISLSIIFVIAGLFSRWRVLYVISFMLIYFGSLLVQPLSPFMDEKVRYLSPVLPLLYVIASGGITNIQNWIKWRIAKQAALPVLVGIVILSFIPQNKMFPIDKFWGKNHSVNMREKVGLLMKENLKHPIKAMSRKPYIPYYADAIFFTTPATYEEVIELANSRDIDYLIVDRDIDFYLQPKLRFLFNPEKAPKDLEFIGGVRHPQTGELYIGLYKIKRQR